AGTRGRDAHWAAARPSEGATLLPAGREGATRAEPVDHALADPLHPARAIARLPRAVHRLHLICVAALREEARVHTHDGVARDVAGEGLAHRDWLVGNARADVHGHVRVGRAPSRPPCPRL